MVVDPVAWGIVGTAVGGTLAIAGNVISVRMQSRTDLERARQGRSELLRDERKDAYLRLLGVCRRMRYLARPGRQRTTVQLDDLGTELSSAVHEVALIAPRQVARAAEQLADATRAYLKLRVEYEGVPETERGNQIETELDTLRRSARESAEAFLQTAREDLALDPITSADSIPRPAVENADHAGL